MDNETVSHGNSGRTSPVEYVRSTGLYSKEAAELQRPCFGSCLEQYDDVSTYIRRHKCALNCKPFTCPRGNTDVAPAWYFDAHRGTCCYCAIEAFCGRTSTCKEKHEVCC